MDHKEVMRTTFAARDFTGEPIPDPVLYEILDHARFAASGGNRQGGRVIVVRDAETKKQMARMVEPASKRYAAQVEAGENPWTPVVPTAVSAQTRPNYQHGQNVFPAYEGWEEDEQGNRFFHFGNIGLVCTHRGVELKQSDDSHRPTSLRRQHIIHSTLRQAAQS